MYDEMFSVGDALLNPDLWRCAGKALGWKKFSCSTCLTPFVDKTSCGCGDQMPPTEETCLLRWHGLLDALASDQTADAYLAGLLTDANGNE